MKKSMRSLVCGVLLCPLLVGCAAGEGLGKEPEHTEQNRSEAAYELIITGLQQELLQLQAAQKLQNADYEARIAELEAALAQAQPPNEVPPQQSGEADPPTESLFSYTQDDRGLTITGYRGSDRQITVPAEIGGVAVYAVGEGAFRNTAVEQVILQDGIREIGWFAFSGCYLLSSAILPSSVTSIGYDAFSGCSSSLRFTCPPSSYASAYAAGYGIPVIAKGN